MLLSALNCDLCMGLCLIFNYVTGAALSESDSGYPSSQGSYNIEGGKLSSALRLSCGSHVLRFTEVTVGKDPLSPEGITLFLLKLLPPNRLPDWQSSPFRTVHQLTGRSCPDQRNLISQPESRHQAGLPLGQPAPE